MTLRCVMAASHVVRKHAAAAPSIQLIKHFAAIEKSLEGP